MDKYSRQTQQPQQLPIDFPNQAFGLLWCPYIISVVSGYAGDFVAIVWSLEDLETNVFTHNDVLLPLIS